MVHLSAVPALAITFGAVLGLGLWLIVASMARLGRASLVDCVAPYVTDFSVEVRAMRARPDSDPGSMLGILILPVMRRLRGILPTVLGGNDAIARRLRQAGSDATVERFHGEQLGWAGGAFAIGAALALFAPTFAALTSVVRVVLPPGPLRVHAAHRADRGHRRRQVGLPLSRRLAAAWVSGVASLPPPMLDRGVDGGCRGPGISSVGPLGGLSPGRSAELAA